MDKDTQLQQLNELLTDLLYRECLEDQYDDLEYSFKQDMEAYSTKNLPVAPQKPKEPKMPTMPKPTDKGDGMVNPALFLVGLGVFAMAANKKKKKDAEAQDKKNWDDYYARKAQYDKDYPKYCRDLEAYNKDSKEYEAAKEKKIAENIEEFKRINSSRTEEMNKILADMAVCSKRIADNKVLPDADKNSDLVEFVIKKLSTNRADSLMMALNMYDEEKRKDREFKARLEFDAFNRRMESEERSRREAEIQREQREHNRKMESLAKDRLWEERRAADELAEIRKAAEKLDR